MPPLLVKIQMLPGHGALHVPRYHTAHAAAMDLEAAVREPIVIGPGAIAVVGTGFAMAVPDGYEAQLRPRSGLAVNHGITLANSPATIDADYRGEVKVALINHSEKAFTVTAGMRIAQVLIKPVPTIQWEVVDTLPPSARGTGGFGHTGQ